MKVTAVKITPLLVPYKKPYYWAQGIIHGAEVLLVAVETDAGITGYGESIASPDALAVAGFLAKAGAMCVGRDPFDNARLMANAYHALFQALGTCSAPRFGGQVLAGLEMALWDVMGKAAGRPVHQLLGGAVHDKLQYFGFAMGETAEEVAAEATAFVQEGVATIYLKVGRGDALDLKTVAAVRAAIGPEIRLRVDANEKWTPVRARRMIDRMADLGVEMVEQPTPSDSLAALAQVRASSPVAIGADQVNFTPEDVAATLAADAADLIVLGVHETGGLTRFIKAGRIAEATGVDVCIHGLYETGITTCAAHQAGAVLPNLDDANQYMNHFLEWDILAGPDLALNNGSLPVLTGPGLGFELDLEAVARAATLWRTTFDG
ncbi:mandelate racemase/muconate lactonizing enzyme family protein [Alisedimentitalea sp. MJ-SS2]|uniref:mandelate racemase/muconate lactonizing enzyme family protein n=1 Tax=Aliisedimentitalea sp. MJ-SS2 TaxID=3049795 RepID=UPI002906E6F9|nr:mandelate racemase/muconate lactonizing enzyme family protein [Alisedimentitalea sp. MJ-SS2]MDU8927785.1 mandelate racemase/muconate lactonizing enzyme family protein [Alisedimentitalea sp. MJ-SS2]